jgi:hypothetical protein
MAVFSDLGATCPISQHQSIAITTAITTAVVTGITAVVTGITAITTAAHNW